MEEFIEQRIQKLMGYLKDFRKRQLRTLDDLKELNRPGVYFIYDSNESLVYVGTSDRPLGERLAELRDQPKDHTFHSKHVRSALESRLGRKIKKYDAKKLSKFLGHELLSLDDFRNVLEDTKLLVRRNYKYRTIEFEDTIENLKEAKALEHLAVAIFQPNWNDTVDRIISELDAVELFKSDTSK